jgi:hypothetical protein
VLLWVGRGGYFTVLLQYGRLGGEKAVAKNHSNTGVVADLLLQ